MTLSLCMIVKNEADTLANALESVKGIFDEIIITDTGSDDDTVAIARQYTDKIYSYQWHDDFAAARNYSFSLASSDYIMWLDADDVITRPNADKLKKFKGTLDGKIREAAALYQVAFDENGEVTMEYYRERIFLKSANFKWSGRIHETVPIEPSCIYADFVVTHKKVHPTQSGRNLKIFEKMKEEGDVFNPRDKYYYARELFYNNRTADAEAMFREFLNEKNAYVENKIDACVKLSECLKIRGESPLGPLFESMAYSTPRAEVCCEIAAHFMQSLKYAQAIFWYELALRVPYNSAGGFICKDCYGYLPNIQLSVLYYSIGNIKKAVEYNDKAAEFKPHDKSVLHNKQFFASLANV